jgi:hypothetical protein
MIWFFSSKHKVFNSHFMLSEHVCFGNYLLTNFVVSL